MDQPHTTHASRYMSFKGSRRLRTLKGSGIATDSAEALESTARKVGRASHQGAAYLRRHVIAPYIVPAAVGALDAHNTGFTPAHGALAGVAGRKLENELFRNPYTVPVVTGAARGGWKAMYENVRPEDDPYDAMMTIGIGAAEGAAKAALLRKAERLITGQSGRGMKGGAMTRGRKKKVISLDQPAKKRSIIPQKIIDQLSRGNEKERALAGRAKLARNLATQKERDAADSRYEATQASAKAARQAEAKLSLLLQQKAKQARLYQREQAKAQGAQKKVQAEVRQTTQKKKARTRATFNEDKGWCPPGQRKRYTVKHPAPAGKCRPLRIPKTKAVNVKPGTVRTGRDDKTKYIAVKNIIWKRVKK